MTVEAEGEGACGGKGEEGGEDMGGRGVVVKAILLEERPELDLKLWRRAVAIEAGRRGPR